MLTSDSFTLIYFPLAKTLCFFRTGTISCYFLSKESCESSDKIWSVGLSVNHLSLEIACWR